MQPFHPRWKTVDVRQLHHPLPRLHLRRMTAMPLQEKERYEATLKQKYDADGQDLPAVGFPGRRRLEKTSLPGGRSCSLSANCCIRRQSYFGAGSGTGGVLMLPAFSPSSTRTATSAASLLNPATDCIRP